MIQGAQDRAGFDALRPGHKRAGAPYIILRGQDDAERQFTQGAVNRLLAKLSR
jgi:hypothetical protein